MKRNLLLMGAIALLATGVAEAKECKGVNFADPLQFDGSNLILNGLGVRKATALKVQVYVAALYVAKPSNDANAILDSNGPTELILHFVRNVGADDLREAWTEGFGKECQGPATGPQGAHRDAECLDDRCEDRRAAHLHSQAGCRYSSGCERRDEGNNQRRRFCEGTSVDLAGAATA